MKRAIFLAALASTSVLAQLQLYTFDGNNERPVAALNDIGSIAVGDSREIRFHARNAGSTPVALVTVRVAGQGFAVSSAPPLPYIIAGGNYAEFRVKFTPSGAGSYSATVTANSAETFLRATAVATASVSVQGRSGVLASGATVDFGRVQKGRSTALEFRISNPTTAPVTVGSINVSGAAFRKLSNAAGPITLAAGDSITVPVAFEPVASGSYSGSLAVDARTFTLAGVGFDPPFPPMTIVLPDSAASGQQQKFAIRFDTASETSGTGTVAMSFEPAPGLGDDPAIRFVSSGGRQASFRVGLGDTAASFGASNELTFQTGTTAGSITFTITLGDAVERRTLTIAPAKVYIDHGSAVRRVNDLDVSVTGYDNSRTAGPLAFTFFDKNGRVIGAGAIRVDAAPQFRAYYASSQVGGAFLFRATFPVTGDATEIRAVEVEMANSSGVTVSEKLTIP
jgi:hypothetical protein